MIVHLQESQEALDRGSATMSVTLRGFGGRLSSQPGSQNLDQMEREIDSDDVNVQNRKNSALLLFPIDLLIQLNLSSPNTATIDSSPEMLDTFRT